MTHNLFHDRFFSYRQPAWHSLGIVSPKPMTAEEAFSAVSPYDVSLQPLRTPSGLETGYRAIVRDPVPDDPREVVFGVVGKDYTLIPPLEMCRFFDEAVQEPVETLGALGKGEILFLTISLPTFDVNGDEVQNYLLVVSPYNALSSIEIRETPVRTVCQNTLVLARALSTQSYKIPHHSSAPDLLRHWLAGVYQQSAERASQIQGALTRLSNLPLKDPQAVSLIETIYNLPLAPEPDPFGVVSPAREMEYAYLQKTVSTSREAVFSLYSGEGLGSNQRNYSGTGWGLYNAVCEWEGYRRSRDAISLGKNTLFGDRGSRMEKAYSVISAEVKA